MLCGAYANGERETRSLAAQATSGKKEGKERDLDGWLGDVEGFGGEAEANSI